MTLFYAPETEDPSNGHGWLQQFDPDYSLDVLRELGTASAAMSRTVEGREIRALIHHERYRELIDYPIPFDMPVRDVRALRQSLAFFQKYEELDAGYDKEANALDAIESAERHCRVTNVTFQEFHSGGIKLPADVCGVLHMAQNHMSRLLGPVPRIGDLRLAYGPGATSSTPKRAASPKRKLGDAISCSEELIPMARAILEELPHLASLHQISTYSDIGSLADETGYVWEHGLIRVHVHHGRVSFVSKNAKTHRTTETQPVLNGIVQGGIGRHLAQRWRGVPGLDLYTQELNRSLACIGSLTGRIATLDLKSASNCEAVRLVQSLVSYDWFNLLKAVRCGLTQYPDGRLIQLEMFAGMGNGFTFPLEAATFWSLARASASWLGIEQPTVAVYGDDIIVDTELVGLLKKVLHYAGFIINDNKSFVDGPFRESCGSDFLQGIDVRPVYAKKRLSPAILFSLHNGLVRRGFTEIAARAHDFVPPELRQYGPDHYGDGHLLSQDEGSITYRPKKRDHGWGGKVFSTFTRVIQRDEVYRDGDRVLHTYTAYTRGVEDLCPKNEKVRTIEGDEVPFLGEVVGASQYPWQKPSLSPTLSNGRLDGARGSFLRAWLLGHGEFVGLTAPLPFGNNLASHPEGGSFGPHEIAEDPVDPFVVERKGWQGMAKACALPDAVVGYKKISIYTLA